MTDYETHAARWRAKADENLEEWGRQRLETLLVVAGEEKGELNQAFLEARAEGGDPARIQQELDDLAAVLYQLQDEVDGLEDGGRE